MHTNTPFISGNSSESTEANKNNSSVPSPEVSAKEEDLFPEEIIFEPQLTEVEQNLLAAEKAKEETKDEQGWETREHIKIGDVAFGEFFEQLDLVFANLLPIEDGKHKITGATVPMIRVNEKLLLTPGEIVALAGDFFGIPQEPISFGKTENEQRAHFINAYNNLTDEKFLEEIQNILAYTYKQTEIQEKPLSELRFRKEKVDGSFKSNIKYGLMTTEGLPGDFCHSRYFKLATNNFDHFGGGAKLSFEIGLKLALERIELAKTITDKTYLKTLLKEALIYLLFAWHFGTDAYASGHIRTPRQPLVNVITKQTKPMSDKIDFEAKPDLKKISSLYLTLAGFFAKKMHDEDSKTGIYVMNDGVDENDIHRVSEDLNEQWKAYGDGMYTLAGNQVNAKKMQEAIVLSLQDLYLSYNNKPLQFTPVFKRLLPKDLEQKNAKEYPPLFRIKNEVMEVRTENGQYRPMELVSTLGMLAKVKIKNTANHIEDVTHEKAEELMAKLTKTDCCII